MKKETMIQRLEKCKRGKHSLIPIHSDVENAHLCIVVRWCPVCGAIVVDADCDNRTYTIPGKIMKMISPSTTKFLMWTLDNG